MSFSRRITLTVLLTLIVSSMSTVFCALEAESTEEPNHTLPVVQGPYAVKLPAIRALKHIPVLRHLPQVKRLSSQIVTTPALPNGVTLTASANSDIETVIAFAMAQLGKPYVWAASGPNSFDCSGLTLAAYATVGIQLPHFTGSQQALGTPVSQSQLQRGDLVFPASHHVAIYLGAGMMIHAPQPGENVKIGPVYSFYTARRFL